MSPDEVLEIVRHSLSERLGVEPDEVVPSAHLRDDLGLDSLDAVDLLSSLRSAYGSLDDLDLAGIQTIGDLVEALRRHETP